MRSCLMVMLLGMMAAATGAAEPRRLPELAFEKYTLGNGLQVILHQDHTTPVVTVNVWYHVGSKNEKPGRTGFAHLFEHLMFQGSAHHPNGYFGPIEEAGGRLNGSTTQDRTNYWETVPRNFLRRVLWMEADRMGYLLPALTRAKLDNQRDVVKNERRQSYENRPYGLAYETILAALYPPDFPYHWPTIGSMADLDRASLGDVAEFFRTYYVPNNASLCIAGDFDPRQAKGWIEEYFGKIPRGKPIVRPHPPAPRLPIAKRLTMTDRVSLPRVYLNWITVPMFAPGDAALDVLADVLARGLDSRLHRRLVYERQIAQDVEADQSSEEISGTFTIMVTARPGHTLKELEQAIDAELAVLKTTPPEPAEVARSVNSTEAAFISSLEPLGGFGGRADQLNRYNTFTGDPGYYRKDLARYTRITPRDVQAAAKTYLTDRRVVLEVVPAGKHAGPAGPVAAHLTAGLPSAAASAPPLEPGQAEAEPAGLPGPGPVAKLKLPPVQRHRLKNGLEVLLVERHELPIVSLNLIIRSGLTDDPAGRAGLATLTADLLTQGTKTRSALEISAELAAIGATLTTDVDWDASSVSLHTLTDHFDRALDLTSDTLLRPTFPPREFDRVKARTLVSLMQLRDSPVALASQIYPLLVYGKNHPYGRSRTGTEASVKVLTRDAVVRFYRDHYRPGNAALIVVGDTTAADLLPRLEKALGGWRGTAVSPAPFPSAPPRRPPLELTLVDKPGAAQSVIIAAQVGVARTTKDYFPLMVMNDILGGQFKSRLNMDLRERLGYTYGVISLFGFRRHAGPFLAMTSVQTRVTPESVQEFLKDLREIRRSQPITDRELKFAKDNIVRRFPATFETSSEIASHLADLVIYNLPNDYFNHYIQRVEAVTKADVRRVAEEYLDPDHMVVLVVGDREAIEPGLKKLAIAPIRIRTADGVAVQ